jgi:glycerophosphoryl diester phosphodiesterase
LIRFIRAIRGLLYSDEIRSRHASSEKAMRITLGLLAAIACVSSVHAQTHHLAPQTPQELQELLSHTAEPLPLVSAHRGGGEQKGFPENCIATFEQTLRHSFALLEIDPRYTKDGAIVVLHDATLDRTTTGSGKVSERTLAELRQLKLKDNTGAVTGFTIPTLDEVLEWARGKAILVLDQKDVPVAARVKKIEEHKAQAYAMLIVGSFKNAEECHKLNPDIMMEVMIPNREKAAEFDKLGIPWRNVVAFVGHVPPEDIGLYEMIHAKGANCMIGTSRNLDKQIINGQVADIKALEPGYREFMKRGADIIETDIPVPLGPMLYQGVKPPQGKQKWFVRTGD